MWEKFDWTAKLGLTRGKVRSGRRDGRTQAFLRLGLRLILVSNIIPVIIPPCRNIHLMLLLILAYLPNVKPDVTQMSHLAQLAVWELLYKLFSILCIKCWSKLGHWTEG